LIRVTLLACTTVLLSFGVFAGELPEEKDANPSDEQIQIVADKLVTSNTEKFAEFLGDVRASQGNFVITSEYLRIYYKDDPQQHTKRGQSGSQGLIKQVVASGNVQVSFEKYTAETRRLEYDLETQIVVLIGENSTMTSGKNILTGSKITFNRRNGQIQIESSPQQRVRAVFHPEEKVSEENAKE
jgi:lipopolysaccharide export system protein LptA